ncbi:hypothetical protein CDAR_294641 [Caerostris darwini]|uniref:Uncharacterized protein n=1 Tax=Caerostris darwini TaxID=1538125 RepID=A0AAV4UKN9_9ARAC|nr:hypothetical protein CDAR_294641 [Caerostris darwini]
MEDKMFDSSSQSPSYLHRILLCITKSHAGHCYLEPEGSNFSSDTRGSKEKETKGGGENRPFTSARAEGRRRAKKSMSAVGMRMGEQQVARRDPFCGTHRALICHS